MLTYQVGQVRPLGGLIVYGLVARVTRLQSDAYRFLPLAVLEET